jgi:hypothetical protein
LWRIGLPVDCGGFISHQKSSFSARRGRRGIRSGVTGTVSITRRPRVTPTRTFEPIENQLRMANFSDVLSKDDAAAIKAFIVHDTLTRRAKGEGGGRSVAIH